MSQTQDTQAPVLHPDRFFIGGEWIAPSSSAQIDVIDSATEEVYFRVAEAQEADVSRAVAAARTAFDEGPWPRLSHEQRAGYLRGIAEGLRARAADLGEIWPRESGVLQFIAAPFAMMAAQTFDFYAGLASTFPFEAPATPTAGGEFGLIVREPVGVVGAIIPWNAAVTESPAARWNWAASRRR